MLGLDELVLERLQRLIIQMKLHFEGSICDALTLAQEVGHLVEECVKVHPAPFAGSEGDDSPVAAHRAPQHKARRRQYVLQMTRKGKPETQRILLRMSALCPLSRERERDGVRVDGCCALAWPPHPCPLPHRGEGHTTS